VTFLNRGSGCNRRIILADHWHATGSNLSPCQCAKAFSFSQQQLQQEAQLSLGWLTILPHSRRSMQKLWCIHANRSSRFLVIGIARFTRTDAKCNQVVPWSLHTFPENFLQIGPAVSPEYKTSQTDRQTTCCAKGATDSTVGQKLNTKNVKQNFFVCQLVLLDSKTVDI